MDISSITKLHDIDPQLPEDDDNISEGAHRMRELRTALLKQFPGLLQALDPTVSDAWLNLLSKNLNVTGGQLDAKSNRIMQVSDGVNPQDAVTFSQLAAVEARVTALEARVSHLESIQ